MIKDIQIQGFLYDQKASFLRGAGFGPALIREVFYSKAINSYSESIQNITECDRFEFGVDFIPETYFDVEGKADEILRSGKRLLSLGGDHSLTYPILRAYAKHYQNIEILHFDAHSDLYHEFEGDPYSHACPFARIIEENLAVRLVQLGIRCLTPHLIEQGEKFGVEVIEMKDYAFDKIPKFTKPMYISLDLDAIDPAFAPGVAHHEPGGFTSRQIFEIIQSLNVPIIGADIMEFNPRRDTNGITASLATKLLKEILAKMLIN